MARTKTTPGTAPSATHAATDPAPAPGTAPAADSPAAAVHAALEASPGSAIAVIADAAGTGKPAARAVLLEMEKDGTATRVKGARPGIPDTWTLAQPEPAPAPAPDGNGPAAEQPGEPDGALGSAAGDEADATGQDDTAKVGNPAPHDEDDAEAGTSVAPGPEAEQPGPDGDVPADGNRENAAPGEQDDAESAPDGAVPDSAGPQDPGDGDGPCENGAGEADAGGEADDAPDPALVTALIERLGQVRAAADAAELVLTASGDLKAALGGLDEIYEQAAEARRSLKAVLGGKKVPSARPGALRDKVLAHLVANPDAELTPHEIHKVLSHSSGAIANALETLVKHGEAEVATEKPRRFRRAAQPAGADPGADGADSAQDEGTELAGAA